MVIRVSPGAKPPHERHGHEKSAKRFGTQLTESIRASGTKPRKQAGHRSVPDQGEPKTRKRPCNAGAIHTGRLGGTLFAQLRLLGIGVEFLQKIIEIIFRNGLELRQNAFDHPHAEARLVIRFAV